ncbi:hypothetical protein [Curtobacterium sp. MCBA15_004]|uniref:hypothetical protein n=1 Tax=Curtobacterium sp. MCBA15_004 TaxID=1898733 RepID=UPI0008DD82B8|nr:hypothetical protein [Curtobacterium sp. MCBA15_004]WIA98029.1 hypothetical protein QOL16_06480 [Curtobacterium sp. MCBA15_004]
MAGSGRISVLVSDELQTLLSALRTVPKDVQGQIRKFTKTDAQPIWQDEIRSRVSTTVDERVFGKTARVRVSNQNVNLEAARIGKSLSGGAKPSEIAPGREFGRNSDQAVTYQTRSRLGKSYRVTRHTKRQLPTRNTNGRVVFPSTRKSIPRFASLWIQTAARTLYDAFDQK